MRTLIGKKSQGLRIKWIKYEDIDKNSKLYEYKNYYGVGKVHF